MLLKVPVYNIVSYCEVSPLNDKGTNPSLVF